MKIQFFDHLPEILLIVGSYLACVTPYMFYYYKYILIGCIVVPVDSAYIQRHLTVYISDAKIAKICRIKPKISIHI